MFPTALSSFTTFFATIGPIEAAVLFAALTPNADVAERRRLALTATLIASIILCGSALLGGPLLHQLGVTIAALQTAGGIILLLLGLEMVFAKPHSMFKLTPPEGAEAQTKDDLAVFPLATPLLAGPGAMSAAILLAAQNRHDALQLTAVFAALAMVMVLTLVMLLGAHGLSRIIGVTAQRVLMRVFGILLAAIAVQAVFNGIAASGVLSR
jgi:multiple antibiotic resistance protein